MPTIPTEEVSMDLLSSSEVGIALTLLVAILFILTTEER
jgi:hypothetical protein